MADHLFEPTSEDAVAALDFFVVASFTTQVLSNDSGSVQCGFCVHLVLLMQLLLICLFCFLVCQTFWDGRGGNPFDE